VQWLLVAAMDRFLLGVFFVFLFCHLFCRFCCLESGAFVAFVLRASAWSAGRVVIMRDVRRFLHMQLGLADHLFADVPAFGFGVVFDLVVLQIWEGSLMWVYSRWRVLVWDPVWSTWNFAVCHLIFS